MNPREFLDILHVAERLKDTPRHCTTSGGRTESVAEHSWRISLMAFLLRHEFPEVNMDRVVDMCLIHDLGECFTGDIPTFLKTGADRKTEASLLDQWVKSLPPEVSADMAALYREMDAQETMEAKICRAMDKLEAVIQHNESPLSTWADNEFELNKTYAFDTVVFSDWLMELRKEILADTLAKTRAGSPPREKGTSDKKSGAAAAKPGKTQRSPAKQQPGLPAAKPRANVTLRRPDRAMWKADGDLDNPVAAPAIPAPVRKVIEQKHGGEEARTNRKLVAELERDAIIAAMEENMPTIQFPEDDEKYSASRKPNNPEAGSSGSSPT